MAAFNPETFAVAVLRGLRAPTSRGNVRALVGWERAEGGHWHNSARFNPLNTTQPAPGAGNTGTQGNIKVYRSPRQGVNATVRTLRNGRYGGILAALARGNDPGGVARAVGASPWGTSASLVASAIRGTPAPKGIPKGVIGGGARATGGGALLDSSTTRDAGPQGSALGLLQALSEQQGPQQAPSVGLAPPSFSARPALPQTYQAPQSGGGPAPKPDLSALLAAVQTSGDTGSSSTSTTVAPADGITQAGSGPDSVRQMFERAVKINGAKLPYKWGGGHGGRVDVNKPVPLDCSGAVSAVLGVNPRVSGQFASWGKPGRGRNVTIYANSHHVLMEINGHFFGTSGTNPGGGAGWIPRGAISSQYLKDFAVRHPAGL